VSFTLPTFNLVCDIYTGPWLSKALRSPGVQCNLAFGKRVNGFPTFDTAGDQLAASFEMYLLLPAGTDVRSKIISGQGDIIDVPAGSSRWYGVFAVDDVGKGFANEHRVADLVQISKFLNATTYAGLTPPIPWP